MSWKTWFLYDGGEDETRTVLDAFPEKLPVPPHIEPKFQVIEIKAYEEIKNQLDDARLKSGWEEIKNLTDTLINEIRHYKKATDLIQRVADHTTDSRYETECKNFLAEKEKTNAKSL